jgi:predicted ABC-type ATPase
MTSGRPHVIIIGGPNGAGKSTTAPSLLKGSLKVTEFVNADTIAQGLSAFRPEAVAVQAGRVQLHRLKALAKARVDFAFETTLASRSFATWINGLCRSGYTFSLVYLWLPSPELAVARVAQRVRLGGHDIPEKTIRRRYRSGLRNFFRLYRPLAASWFFYDNSLPYRPILLASGNFDTATFTSETTTWSKIEEQSYGT